MFAYLRYFSIIAFLVVIVAAAALGYYFRDTATDDVVDLVAKNNRALVQGYVNQVWRSHPMAQFVEQARSQKNPIPEANWRRYRGYKEIFSDFSEKTYRYFEEMPIVQVTIYTADAEPIITINRQGIASGIGGTSLEFMSDESVLDIRQQAESAEPGSRFLHDAEVKGGPEAQDMAVVQTVTPVLSSSAVELLSDPLYSKANNVEVLIEVYTDVTRQWNRVSRFQYIGTGGIIILFLVLIFTLIFVAAKAEGIIAKQHEANLELAAQAAAAEAENRNKSQFLANISHELRTPLNAIIGFSEIIKNEVMGQIENPQYQDYIRDIHASGVHLLSLINDILDYSKAEAGKLDLNLTETDVTKTIQNSIRLVSPRAEQGQITLAEDIPKEHYVIETDSKKLKQIMLNLLSNAVKFTPPGGEVKITLWQDVVDDSLTVEVRDSGIGIAQKDISKALAPFGQVDSALSRRYEGTGLGLPLTKKFVELLGGTFQIQSEENAGTTVTFVLPKKVPMD